MKVLLINNCHYPRGGTETVYFNTAQLLKDAGHEVIYCSFADNKNTKTGDKEYFINKGGVVRQLFNYFNNRDAASVMDKLLKIEKPDIAHAHLMWGGMTASIIPILHKHGVPLVHSVHDYRMICPAYTFRSGKGVLCEKCKVGHYWACFSNLCSKGDFIHSAVMSAEMYYRNAKWPPSEELDGLIYVSNFIKKKHEEIDRRFASVLNTVLYNYTAVGEGSKPLVQDGGYYLYYGRLSGEKGIKTLMDAIVHFPEIHLKIVGSGPIEGELKNRCQRNVEFLGFKKGEDLYDLIRNARFVCVPSEWYENNPMTIIEAYSLGVPVIGATIGGIPEIIVERETGYLFESGNVDSLRTSLERSISLNNCDYNRMKDNALAFAHAHFDKRNYYPQLISFYDEVIKKYNRENSI